ncbi:hypothetical protein MTQ00_22040 [Chryseobacterium sp. B21-037]|nr:hypothetical protein [Chryseobacterium sp. B21-037]WBV56364.1 hypothetical protein PFY10_19440 [Chryseobacterium daecheongense]
MGDTSYVEQPKFIDISTSKNFSRKMLKHCLKNSIKDFFIILHGGEPLLMGKSRLEEFIECFSIFKDNYINVFFSIQTNGILINDEWCNIFKKHEIQVGISLDGPKEINDLFRVDKKGKGTHDKVMKGIRVLERNKTSFGILSVMNSNASATTIYNNFIQSNIKSFDILFMDTNHDHIKVNNQFSRSMFDWYKELFDLWFINKEDVVIRIFDIIVKKILGQEIEIDILGTSENNVLVLETNGELEAVDILKICGEGFTKTNLNVNNNIEIDDVAKNNLINVYYNSGKMLARKCLACPIMEVCGGGYIAHRYKSSNGFNNPSAYCDDLIRLITYIQNTVIDAMPYELKQETQIEKLTYKDAIRSINEALPTIPEPTYTNLLESFRKPDYEVI